MSTNTIQAPVTEDTTHMLPSRGTDDVPDIGDQAAFDAYAGSTSTTALDQKADDLSIIRNPKNEVLSTQKPEGVSIQAETAGEIVAKQTAQVEEVSK